MKKISFFTVAVVLLIIIYSLISQIFSAFRSGDRLSEALDKLHQLQIKNQALKKSLKTASSPEFIEQQARDKLGLSKEDEVVVVIPEEIIQKILSQTQPNVPRLPNPIGWWKVFF
ncbi:MAG: septum formation initiator family protein [Candidatus Daviesbacteria bacterium]|nr:MAG: septum formation initiator family protein [Candidatus Daviesbacteria bacterium]